MCPAAGGGGSFNAGTNQTNIAGINLGMGSVIITNLCTATAAPTITTAYLSNITVNNDPGICGAAVTYAVPSGTDNCGTVAATLSTGFASGATFPVGTTTVSYDIINIIGTVSCSFTVTVVDAEIPTIVCPANITVSNDAGTCDAIVSFANPVGANNCSGVTVALTSGLASGSAFPLGVSTVTFTATDAASNASTPCSFTVTVVDTTAPTVTCPSNIVSCDPIVTGLAPATADNCIGEYVTYTLTDATTGSGADDASGSIFNVGTTTVQYLVTDSAGNSANCSFDVTVHPVTAVTIAPFSPDTVCWNATTMLLPTGTPTGGTYSGLGVVDTMFNPDTSGVGAHYIVYTDANSCTNSDSTMIVVDLCTGVEENLSIYPNPTNGLIHINLGNHNGPINYTISTIEGRIVNQM